MPEYLLFLQSSRFHALVLSGLLLWFVGAGTLSLEAVQPILLVLLGHIGIRTVDRFAENVGN